jgi:hypothetical protein
VPRARIAQLAALVLGLAASAASAASGDAFTTFRTPTGNIGCAYSKFAGEPALLRCDIRSGLVPRPPRPEGCDLDWAYGYVLAVRGRAHTFCAGDTALDPRGQVLAYGSGWTRGGYACVSRVAGLMCRNRSGHGFVLSRPRSKTF